MANQVRNKTEQQGTQQTKNVKRISLQSLKDAFLVEQACRNNSRKTITYYNENISRFVDHCATIGIEEPVDLNKSAVQKYILFLRESKKWAGMPQETGDCISSKTLQTYTRAIKVWLSWLFDEGYISDSALLSIKLPKAKRAAIEILTIDEFKQIIEFLHTKKQNRLRDVLFISMLYETGMRLNEAVTLQLSDVNLAAGSMKILGKGNKERFVYFGANLARLIQRYVNQERPHPAGKTGALFLQAAGDAVSQACIKRLFRTLQSELDMKRLHAHLFRHTFCTNYLKKGGDIFSLKALTGHESFEILNMYLHLAKCSEVLSTSVSLLDDMNKKSKRK